MPTMTDNRSVAANTRTTNILAGKAFEFVSTPSIIKVHTAAAAVGVNIDLLIGGESIVSDEEISDANRFPTIDGSDLIAQHGGLAGERLFIALRNTTGAAIVVKTLVEVLPL